MPQTCTICRHQKREEIDQALLAGQPYRSIAGRYGTSAAAVYRHGRDHVAVALVKARDAAEEVQAGTLFERLRAINRDTQEILREARGSQNHVIALQAIGRVEKQLELEARLLGELDESTRIAVGVQVNTEPKNNPALDKFLMAQTSEALDRIEQAMNLLSVFPGVEVKLPYGVDEVLSCDGTVT